MPYCDHKPANDTNTFENSSSSPIPLQFTPFWTLRRPWRLLNFARIYNLYNLYCLHYRRRYDEGELSRLQSSTNPTVRVEAVFSRRACSCSSSPVVSSSSSYLLGWAHGTSFALCYAAFQWTRLKVRGKRSFSGTQLGSKQRVYVGKIQRIEKRWTAAKHTHGTLNDGRNYRLTEIGLEAWRWVFHNPSLP